MEEGVTGAGSDDAEGEKRVDGSGEHDSNNGPVDGKDGGEAGEDDSELHRAKLLEQARVAFTEITAAAELRSGSTSGLHLKHAHRNHGENFPKSALKAPTAAATGHKKSVNLRLPNMNVDFREESLSRGERSGPFSTEMGAEQTMHAPSLARASFPSRRIMVPKAHGPATGWHSRGSSPVKGARSTSGAGTVPAVSQRTWLEEELEFGRPYERKKSMRTIQRTSMSAPAPAPPVQQNGSTQQGAGGGKVRRRGLSKELSMSFVSRDTSVLREYRESEIAMPAFQDDQEFTSSGATKLCLPGFVIDNHSVWYIAWWWIIVGLTFWTAFYTPWYIAFEYSFWTLVPGGEDLVVYKAPIRSVVIDAVTSIFFITDIIVNFNLAVSRNGLTVIDRSFIALRYLKSTFVLDVLGAVPLGSFIIYVNYWTFTVSSDATYMRDVETTVRFLYLLDLLSLARLHRIWQLARMLNLRRNDGRTLYVSVLIRNIFIAFFWVHWGACIFFIICELDVSSQCGLFVKQFSMDTRNNFGSWYLLSFYWSVVTFSTVGYGDISPIGLAGMIFTCIYVLASITVTAFVVGTITSALNIFDSTLLDRRTNNRRLKQFSDSHHLSEGLRRELEKEFRVVEEVRNQGDEAALAGLPSTVRNDAMQYVYLPHLERCPLLKKCSKHFLHMLLSHAHVEVFTKKSRILSWYDPVDELAVIAFGNAIVEYGVFGDVTAEDPDGVLEREISKDRRRSIASVASQHGLLPVVAGPSDILGAISFFTELPQPESVTVQSDLCHVVTIPRAAYMEASNHYPQDAYFILEALYNQMNLLMRKVLETERRGEISTEESFFTEGAEDFDDEARVRSEYLDPYVSASFRRNSSLDGHHGFSEKRAGDLKPQIMCTMCQLVIQKDWHRAQLVRYVAGLLLNSCLRGNLKQVEEILSEERIAGWNPVNAQDDEGLSAVMIAAQNGHVRLVKALITHGADLTLADKYGNTALSMAVSQGHMRVCLMLQSKGARLEVSDWRAAQMLCTAVANNEMEQLMLLLAVGLPVNAQYNLNGTALHVAVERNNVAAVRVLVREWHADTAAKDCHGRTPLQIAYHLRDGARAVDKTVQTQIVEILEDVVERRGATDEHPLHDISPCSSHDGTLSVAGIDVAVPSGSASASPDAPVNRTF